MPQATQKTAALSELEMLLKERWPEACVSHGVNGRKRVVRMPIFARLVPDGIPAGQLLEISGGASSGKTSLLFKFLSGLGARTTVAYFDFAESFNPSAAASCGNDIDSFLVVRPPTIPLAIRSAELLFEYGLANCLVFDLVGQTQEVPRILLHRLRQQAIRAGVLVIFLTEDTARLLPASMVSLRLAVRKVSTSRIAVTTTRSRISPEGITTEFRLNELQ
jgi:hypothetical protein